MQPSTPKYKIAFIDWSPLAYDVSYPLHHPMGGSESSACYLASELAARGHDVTLINGIAQPGVTEQVKLFPNSAVSPAYFHEAAFDAVVVLKGSTDAAKLKPALAQHTKLFLWTGHAADQESVQILRVADIHSYWDGIIAVSAWQRQEFIRHFSLPPERVHVLRNAISPAFENLFAGKEDLRAAKAPALRLAYTSTPFRGLDVLLGIFQRLNGLETNAKLEIYSSMQVYGIPAASDSFAALYQAAQSMKNVQYIGSLSQAKLAQALIGVSILSYPNTFAETSCIAVMEAMAAGMYVITSDLGALPETTAGYGYLVPTRQEADRQRYGDNYLRALKDTIDRIKQDAFIERQYEQVLYANRELTWKTRAAEWELLLSAYGKELRNTQIGG